MIKLQIQSEADDSAVEIIKSAIAAEIKRLEIGQITRMGSSLVSCILHFPIT